MSTLMTNVGHGTLDKAIARLVDESDNPDFERVYLDVLRRVVSFDLAMIAIYEDNRILRPMCNTLPYGVDGGVLETYADRTYRYSPFFQRHRRGLASGVYVMEELARSSMVRKPTSEMDVLEIDDREEIGYCTIGWPKRLKELDIAIRLSKTQTAQIALYRLGAARFGQNEVDVLLGMRNTLAAIYARFWRGQQRRTGPDGDRIVPALQHLAGGKLSRREVEVLRLIAEGLSSEDVSAELQIGRETIRTHRKRAYQKLGIRSQLELFAALLAHGRQAGDRAPL